MGLFPNLPDLPENTPGVIRKKDIELLWNFRKFIVGKIVNTLAKKIIPQS